MVIPTLLKDSVPKPQRTGCHEPPHAPWQQHYSADKHTTAQGHRNDHKRNIRAIAVSDAFNVLLRKSLHVAIGSQRSREKLHLLLRCFDVAA